MSTVLVVLLVPVLRVLPSRSSPLTVCLPRFYTFHFFAQISNPFFSLQTPSRLVTWSPFFPRPSSRSILALPRWFATAAAEVVVAAGAAVDAVVGEAVAVVVAASLAPTTALWVATVAGKLTCH